MQGASGVRIVRINYAVRASAFAYCFVVIALHLRLSGGTAWDWAALVAQFLVYPHVLYLRASRVRKPGRLAMENLFMDSALLGIWCAHLGFPTWISFALLGGTTLNAAVNRGTRGLALSLFWAAAGSVMWISVGGFVYRPGTGDLVTAMCFFGGLAYSNAMGWVAYMQNRRLAEARDRVLLARKVLEGMVDGIMLTDANGVIVDVNRAFTDITGFSAQECIGSSEASTRRAMQPPDYHDSLWDSVRRAGYWSGTTWSSRKNGDLYREWRSVTAIRDDSGTVTNYVIIISDVEADHGRADVASEQLRA